MGVYADGIQTLHKELDSMKKWDMKSFSFSDFNVVSPDPDTATMTYKVMVEGTPRRATTPQPPTMPGRYGESTMANGAPSFTPTQRRKNRPVNNGAVVYASKTFQPLVARKRADL